MESAEHATRSLMPARTLPLWMLAACLSLSLAACDGRSMNDEEAAAALDEMLQERTEEARAYAAEVDARLSAEDYDPARIAEEIAARQAEAQAE